MIVLGVILVVLGLIFGIGWLVVVGAVLALFGVFAWVAHTEGPVRGRWY